MSDRIVKSLAELASDALAVQDACNIGGVSRSFAEAIKDLHTHERGGTDAIRRHPITRMWAYKILELTGDYGGSSDMQSDAWAACQKIVDDAKAAYERKQLVDREFANMTCEQEHEELEAAGQFFDKHIPCCEKEDRSTISGGCVNCGDPCL